MKISRLVLLMISLGIIGAGPARGADYVTQWGPELGTTAPLLRAQDQDGVVRERSDLAGERGLLLFFSRSADW